MAWSDQCKISFAVTVRAKRNRGACDRSVTSVIKEISKESGVPARTLHRWWAEVEDKRKSNYAKNGTTALPHQNDDQNQVDQKAKVDQRPLCECGRPAKPGKVKADGTQSFYKKCQKCLRATAAPAPKTDGMHHAEMAIFQLEQIKPEDPSRREAIRRVLTWIGQIGRASGRDRV